MSQGKFEDLTGKVFGDLTVIKRVENNKNNKICWLCKCNCGKETIVEGYKLKSGKRTSCNHEKNIIGERYGKLVVAKKLEKGWLCKCDCGNEIVANKYELKNKKIMSCGCYRKEVMSELKRGKLEGKRYGRLTVIKALKINSKRNVVWLCKCDCGKYTEATTDLLNRGEKKSCGCLKTNQFSVTHGHSNTRLFRIWSGMKTRCSNSNREEYKYYGALGIKVCEEWKSDFQAFYDWSMSHGYNDNLTIDRINPYGNYEPSNCRWATWTEQNLNKRTSHKET